MYKNALASLECVETVYVLLTDNVVLRSLRKFRDTLQSIKEPVKMPSESALTILRLETLQDKDTE